MKVESQEFLKVVGGERLSGVVDVAGAKNSALPMIVSCLLSSGVCTINNVPDLEDIYFLLRLLKSFGASCQKKGNTVKISVPKVVETKAPYWLVKSLRASFWVLGPLVARAGEGHVSLPGGDAIGGRPVDLHISGLEKFGAEVRMRHGVVSAYAPYGLKPAVIDLAFPSVGATHHLMMTAALIEGESVINNAAREPEIVEVANLLSQMGAKVEGAGTSRIIIWGQKELGGAVANVLGDRIEALTYLIATAMTGGELVLRKFDPKIIESALELLRQMGCQVSVKSDGLALVAPKKLKSIDFATGPFPGIPTDCQPLFMAALTVADGESQIEETIFESRFGQAAEYRRFGAQIKVEGSKAHVYGVEKLSGAPVEALDIRAAAGVLLMALVAEGESYIQELHHFDRGYENLVEKFSALGANLKRSSLYSREELVVGC